MMIIYIFLHLQYRPHYFYFHDAPIDVSTTLHQVVVDARNFLEISKWRPYINYEDRLLSFFWSCQGISRWVRIYFSATIALLFTTESNTILSNVWTKLTVICIKSFVHKVFVHVIIDIIIVSSNTWSSSKIAWRIRQAMTKLVNMKKTRYPQA